MAPEQVGPLAAGGALGAGRHVLQPSNSLRRTPSLMQPTGGWGPVSRWAVTAVHERGSVLVLALAL